MNTLAEVQQPFLRYPKLAKQLAMLATTMGGVSLEKWNAVLDEINSTISQAEATKTSAAKLDVRESPGHPDVLPLQLVGYIDKFAVVVRHGKYPIMPFTVARDVWDVLPPLRETP